MKYTVSNIHENEYPQLIQLWEKSVRATHHFLKEEDLLFYKELIPSYLSAVNLRAIRDTQNTILGFMGTSDDAIEMLFINPNHRGRGIGKTLAHYAIHQLNISKVDVNEQNDQALAFYLHLGFQVANRSALDGSGKPYPILLLELDKK